MKQNHHHDILESIRSHAGVATQHTFLDNYLGNEHPRYPISAPALRKIAKEWMRDHRDLDTKTFAKVITNLIEGESATEKFMAGILLDYSTTEQRQFSPALFDRWLDNLVGWAEVDNVCTGDYTITEIPEQWKAWKPLLIAFSKSKNSNKRRASLVLLCSPLRNHDDARLSTTAFDIIDRLKGEKEILITKAISWVLRSMYKYHREALTQYLKANADTLPKIAVRETQAKLKTGVKNKRK